MEDTAEQPTPELRIAAIVRAIELGVDVDDFRFIDPTERDTWFVLAVEHEARLDKGDTIWIAA